MIRKLIDRILNRTTPRGAVRGRPKSYPGAAHGVRIEDVSDAAMRTCRTLQQAGFNAYVVGGGVRDLMLGLKPKDFDVATDATPDQVRGLFRRSRIIGRRFQIVHVMFGRETIEVSTFRAIQDEAETDEHGRVLRDNVWGTQAEDAARRDFTINALYYDPVADTILDYHNGVRDLERRTLRMIGDPAARFREDPVRMLRVARFTGKLGFRIEPKTRKPIRELASLVHNVPAARLFDEMLKLLLSGHAMACLQELRREGLHHGLLPMLDLILGQPDDERFVTEALAATDARVRAGKTTSPGFLFAALLWQPVRVRWQAGVARGEHSIPALGAAIDSVLDEQAERIAIQRRFIADMREIWMTQARFERRVGRSPHTLVTHPRFRAAWDFLQLRCQSGEAPVELADWWRAFSEADADEREAMQARLPRAASGAAKKRRRRSGSRTGAAREGTGTAEGAAPAMDGAAAATPAPSGPKAA
ncbi:MAG: polynucleotide adenylyltransferase PcnB [Burkholderiaceae bacterium]|nr:polynucleotide adenylyltransferase PcnB [Burkholderiaceae bacterium]MEB2349985.1 polynucleotide adenylyltransferase PcnB [Burkholderiaceae bacterium]